MDVHAVALVNYTVKCAIKEWLIRYVLFKSQEELALI